MTYDEAVSRAKETAARDRVPVCVIEPKKLMSRKVYSASHIHYATSSAHAPLAKDMRMVAIVSVTGLIRTAEQFNGRAS